MRAWCAVHKALLVTALLLVTVLYFLLALIDPELAQTVGIGYAVAVLTVSLLTRLGP